MARKDYAKKRNSGAAASRAPRRKSAPAKPAKKPFPLIRVIFSLLFLVGFGYALWQLTSVKPDDSQTNSSQAEQTAKQQPSATRKSEPVNKPAAKPAQVKKPAPATASTAKQTKQSDPSDSGPPVVDQSERFEFYKMLPNSQVDTTNVEPYKSTPKDAQSKHTYILQAGSFQSGSDAERMRARLILEGLPNVQTRKVTNSNGTIWHQVRTGPFDNRSMLNKAQDRLVRMNIQPLVKRID
ncbi:SPOR domain-containing protein [Amphritea balenae]|uniref:SPOR domain-containing protein n=1 Tax=Amphritea balenae TaxID=452629 RepID=A0A3P1SJB2_9GAMM|nr:SPOR domain-containing protein [Amphritea balenae]RRC97238.1 hypothetical protein EHS89_18690 [Amphritea balenae]GGK64384.1 hypothetical protein GCM10007941_13210 [Amphritea balenae]